MFDSKQNRRIFIRDLSLLTGAFMANGFISPQSVKSKMNLGLVTYLWGKDWDVPTIIKNCSAANIHGVELRVEHAHGVEPTISEARRKEVKKIFADSPV